MAKRNINNEMYLYHHTGIQLVLKVNIRLVKMDTTCLKETLKDLKSGMNDCLIILITKKKSHLPQD